MNNNASNVLNVSPNVHKTKLISKFISSLCNSASAFQTWKPHKKFNLLSYWLIVPPNSFITARKTQIWKQLFLSYDKCLHFWCLLNLLINIGIQSICVTWFKTSFTSKRTSSTCISDYNISWIFFEIEWISHILSNVADSMNADKNVGNFNSFPTKSCRQRLFGFCADAHQPSRATFMTMS